MRSWVQILMDACLNLFYTNAIYKHIHHGEYKTCTSCLNVVKKIIDKIGKEKNNLIFLHNM
jgi:sulfur relay (sulfurtransferase) DsrC/TusE family protein